MAMPTTASKSVCFVFLLTAFAGVVIALAGLAQNTNLCREKEHDFSSLGPADSTMEYECGVHFSLTWWIIFLQIFAVVTGIVATVVPALHNKHFVLFTFAVVTTLFHSVAYQAVVESYVYMDDNSSKYAQATKAIAAGSIAVLASNFIFALYFAKEDEAPAAAEAVKA